MIVIFSMVNMYHTDTEILFPLRVIPCLQGLRGKDWNDLIDQVLNAENASRDQSAFTLMMVRMGGCQNCNADSFRAMRGCTQCARNTVRRYRGTDHDLIELFHQTTREVDQYRKGKGSALG